VLGTRSRLNSVFEQRRDRHGSDAAGDGGYRGRLLTDFVVRDIADEFVVDAVYAYVHDDDAFRNHVGCHELGHADSGDDYVGCACVFLHVFGTRVTDGHRRVHVARQKECCEGLSDDFGASDYGYVFSLYLNAVFA
jgi:hypothetical protein